MYAKVYIYYIQLKRKIKNLSPYTVFAYVLDTNYVLVIRFIHTLRIGTTNTKLKNYSNFSTINPRNTKISYLKHSIDTYLYNTTSIISNRLFILYTWFEIYLERFRPDFGFIFYVNTILQSHIVLFIYIF